MRRADSRAALTLLVLTAACCALACVVLTTVTHAEGSQGVPAAQLNYMLQCQGCHKSNGEGIEGSVPDLRVYGRQLLSVPEGRQYFISVPGSANAPLSDQELADVLNFIISDIIKDPDGESGSLMRFAEEEVARYRSIKIPDVKRSRAELLRAVAGALDTPE